MGKVMPENQERIEIPAIELKWSEWTSWYAIVVDARSAVGVQIPNGQPGVYEVRRNDDEIRLTIGKAADLRKRVRQGLVKGKNRHSSGTDIRAKEDLSALVVRWAKTSRPSAVEEELHLRHIQRFGRLPLYTDHT